MQSQAIALTQVALSALQHALQVCVGWVKRKVCHQYLLQVPASLAALHTSHENIEQ
jgi:hypothetical protein